MDVFNAIIIDDEHNLCEALDRLLQMYCPDLNICGIAHSAQQGRVLLAENHIDLIFLDIKMPGEDGFSFLSTISSEDYAIIITTAYEQFALKAIKANAIDYLLKPINSNELVISVEKAIRNLIQRRNNKGAQKLYNEAIEGLKTEIEKNLFNSSKIVINDQSGFKIIEVEEIKYLEADGNYTIIYLNELKNIVSSKSLKEFEKVLDPKIFFRIHKSFIVNLNDIKEYSNYQGSYAILDDSTKIPISRRKLNQFKDLISLITKDNI